MGVEVIAGSPPNNGTCWQMSLRLLHRTESRSILYDNSLMEHDVPQVFEFPDRPLFELPISTVLDDWQQFGVDLAAGDMRMASVKDAFSLWRDELVGLAWYGGLFSPTFHPNLVGRPGTLRELAALVEAFREGHGIWWANGVQIAEHCRQLHESSAVRTEAVAL